MTALEILQKINESRRQLSVLLVEDNDLDAILATEQLGEECDVYHANDGTEAINMAICQDFDIAIIDNMLGAAKMNGIEVAKRIKILKPEMLILIHSGSKHKEFSLELIQNGFAFLPKTAHAKLAPFIKGMINAQEKQYAN